MPPVGVERILSLHCLQQWFNLLDLAVEEALYDSRAMRQFVGINLGREPDSDETTICTFRHRLEVYQVGAQLLAWRESERIWPCGVCRSAEAPSWVPPS